MKNISLILNFILLIAVAFLYYRTFNNSSNNETVQEANSEISIKDLSIAFINSDSLFANYKYYEVVGAKLDEKRIKLQQEYTRRAEGLQTQIEDYQRTLTNLTIAQARAVEEDLGRKSQNLRQYQETITQELLKQEAAITQELYNKIATFLKSYGDANNLQVVLTYSQGSNLLYANEALNITGDVIEGLNILYDEDLDAIETDTSLVN